MVFINYFCSSSFLVDSEVVASDNAIISKGEETISQYVLIGLLMCSVGG